MTDVIPQAQPLAADAPQEMPPAATPVAVSTSVRDGAALVRQRSLTWERPYLTQLLIADLISAGAAIAVGWITRLQLPSQASERGYVTASLLITAGWLACLYVGRAYEIRRIATAAREIQRVLNSSVNIAGLTAIVAFLGHIEMARSFVVVVIPIGALIMAILRCCIRRNVHWLRLHGMWTSAILAIGTAAAVRHLVSVVQRNPFAGLVVVGACVEDGETGDEVAPGVPVVGDVEHAAALAESIGADVVAVAGSGLSPLRLRELGWALEGTGCNMVVAPGLTDVAGPRLHISPVEGLPLMWVDQPQFSGLARVIKRAVDVIGASVLLVLSAPLLLLIGLIVRCTTPGPALYRSTRRGFGGREFTLLKFRSMYAGSDERRSDLSTLNESDGLLFKMRLDPRVTRVGRMLRKYSLDELPQLVNVLCGSMSLVGPRPPLPDEVSRYHDHVHRRLLVKPGMTGLWQVSGRSDLAWEESLRLDLYYVENWSLGLDLAIIGRTVWAVIRGRGAY
jgi:exopolysaccharide biosynthesis polyprenyl glycosylphosphotransferase